jgi:hypothetical protein
MSFQFRAATLTAMPIAQEYSSAHIKTAYSVRQMENTHNENTVTSLSPHVDNAATGADGDGRSPIAEQTEKQKPSMPSISKAKAMLDKLDDLDTRTVLAEILESQPLARATLRAFCKRPKGSAGRPFDFVALLKECKEAARVVESSEWQEADEDEDREQRSKVWKKATEPIEWAIDEIQDLCKRSTTSTVTRVQSVEALLDIADLLENSPRLDGADWDYDDMREEFTAAACDAIEEAARSIKPEDKDAVSRSPAFQALLERCCNYNDKAPGLVDIMIEFEEPEEEVLSEE